MIDVDKDFLHLARLSLEGKNSDVAALVRRSIHYIIKKRPDLAEHGKQLLKKTVGSALERSATALTEPIPVDIDSRLELVKRESSVFLDFEPIWSPNVGQVLDVVIEERNREAELLDVGLAPTRSILLIGPPGVGKTLSARWLAMKLERPLLVLDLAAVMSSYLGKTGNNIRAVLKFAQTQPSILLLDEFDAIAKRRDDAGEMGELKRLVNVLLQAVDEWPPHGLLLAATNHPELLDPAIWRRFDRLIEFPIPTISEQEKYIHSFIGNNKESLERYVPLLVAAFDGLTFAEIEREIKSILRESVIKEGSIANILDVYLSRKLKPAELDKKLELARILEKQGRSQREIHQLTGLSRDTLREYGVGIRISKSKMSKQRS
jgi:SpoVK/Ycf46/Vps4 family AAA+-type ATPase